MAMYNLSAEALLTPDGNAFLVLWVTDGNGKPVTDLPNEQFEVTDTFILDNELVGPLPLSAIQTANNPPYQMILSNQPGILSLSYHTAHLISISVTKTVRPVAFLPIFVTINEGHIVIKA